jgi:hypothetical protein
MNDNNKTPNDTPTWEDIKGYWAGTPDGLGWKGGMPYCPDGGTYTIGKVAEPPICSLRRRGHMFPSALYSVLIPTPRPEVRKNSDEHRLLSPP